MTLERNETRLSAKRVGYIIAIIITFIIGIAIMAYRSELLLDEILCLVSINIVFLIAFVLSLMKKRLQNDLPAGQSMSYKHVYWMLSGCWASTIAFAFCPDYFAPVMFVSVLLTTVLDDALSLAIGFYFIIMQCVTCGLSVNVLYCYCILAILGVLLSAFLKESSRTEMLYIYIIFFLFSVIVPIVFYYIAFLEMDRKVFIYAIISGLVCCLVLTALYQPLYRLSKSEERVNYIRLIEENYPLVIDIKNFSKAEYNHAKRVSKLSAFCAKEIGANEKCAACAGFYYRLGKMEGEPEIDNALKLANNHCFPGDVMDVMEEYGGILRLPQTPESAIVHMVDALVTKIELLDQDTMSSTWNQDMVIYQTLNELSQKGFYDESKMSMNQFLKIREKLVQEDSLL